MRRLPFLNGVRAFEATARGGSFARAAEELHVSPAAVSRLVRLLEQRLGVALGERGANRLALTAAGRTYQAGLTRILDSLAELTDQVTAASRRRVLTVGVGPTFAIRWLIPSLTGFRARAPDTEGRTTAGGQATPFDPDWSCGITLGDGDWPDWLEDDRENQEETVISADETGYRRDLLREALDVLNDRERDIIVSRRLDEEPKTLEDLSLVYGVSRERIRQIEVHAFDKLQRAVRNADTKRRLGL